MSDVHDRVDLIRGRIKAAARRAGREPREVTLVGASKRQSLDRLQDAWDAGVQVFGENRVQEALNKQGSLPPGIEWHLIGPLQSNKARRAVETFNTIHSIDRLKIARAVERHALETDRQLEGLLQVNIAAEPSKHGYNPDDIAPQIEELGSFDNLRIVGLMAIPPFEPELEQARHWFGQLRDLRDKLFSTPAWSDRPGYLSMGMSHDFEAAIEEGATHVRVGSALFGPRPEAIEP
jgi:pyridoxal phosphate enzyme (YggS family)